ncbi:MAG: glycosyltransferase [Akkermansia sp.]|nr:glycosyltransferase [Akkermansia sp.]
MKVLQIASGEYASTYGGGQVYVRRLVHTLQQIQGVEVCVVSPSARKEVKQTFLDGVRVYGIPEAGFRNELAQVIQRVRPDVVHAHGMKAQAAEVCKAMAIPCVVTAHHGGILCPAGALLNDEGRICSCPASIKCCLGCVLNNIRWGKLAHPLMRWLPHSLYLKAGKLMNRLPFMPLVTPVAQAACQIQNKLKEWNSLCANGDIIIAPSQAIADAMQRNGLIRDKITVIPHGVDIPANAPEYPAVTDGKIKFYYVGRINYVKGLHVLIKAFMQIPSANAELHVIGGTETASEMRYMEQLQRESASDTRIIWHGKQPETEVAEHTKHYHILINPSICLETFGLNISEALSAGKWVLSTRCGGAEQQIKEGRNGWLIMADSVNEMKDAMEKIHQNLPACSPAYKGYIRLEEHARQVLQAYHHVAEKR